MARRGHGSSGAGTEFLAFLIVVAIAIAIIKWLLITIAILTVPFGAWYLWDRSRQRSPDQAAMSSIETLR